MVGQKQHQPSREKLMANILVLFCSRFATLVRNSTPWKKGRASLTGSTLFPTSPTTTSALKNLVSATQYMHVMNEWKMLEEHLPDSIYVWVCETHIDLMSRHTVPQWSLILPIKGVVFGWKEGESMVNEMGIAREPINGVDGEDKERMKLKR
ncbi:hypothetical protein PIB30_071251 [Stylosanthes scabra]|uniref:Uncharacterized protein n=1 Tax=Stylosanthes scabra TaxID=79078 RepID=A0ABU6ZMI1_9FABA|nr:hypothetical protein [Stylosanthes scabra]